LIIDFTPYSIERNLVKAYTESMSLLKSEDYGILRDADSVYTTPDYMECIYYNIISNPEIKFFTATTNRIGNGVQKDTNCPKGNDYEEHRKYGIQRQKEYFKKTKDITDEGTISGFWMCIKKELWDRIEQPTTTRILHVDTHIHRQVKKLGERIYLLRGLYLYHYYSNYDGIGERDKSHLL